MQLWGSVFSASSQQLSLPFTSGDFCFGINTLSSTGLGEGSLLLCCLFLTLPSFQGVFVGHLLRPGGVRAEHTCVHAIVNPFLSSSALMTVSTFRMFLSSDSHIISCVGTMFFDVVGLALSGMGFIGNGLWYPKRFLSSLLSLTLVHCRTYHQWIFHWGR